MKISNSALVTLVVALFMGLFTSFAQEPALKSGIDRSNFDSGVRPQDDLYRSINGKWLKESTIPSDRPSSGAFMDLRDRSEKQVLSIIEDAAKTKDNADAQKISDLYLSFMDESKANKLGLSPIQAELDVIAAIKDKAELIRELAALQRVAAAGLFRIFVRTDSKKSDQ